MARALQQIIDRRGDDIAWVPNARVRLRQRVVMPDFLLLGPSGWVALEVDGPQHRGKWALDRSKDMALEDAGAAYVGRLDVAATDHAVEVDQYLQRLFRKVAA